ncbi:ABC transporter substrate-binding protein [Paenibacillus sp. MMS18-CY102]|uniref:ABC transporter substrate-binding protein n=1 Tax=Paenibacillus sp. MMS18-CY102 TaxID=2682849 RepID=UPI0013663100|nr:extracellular solute-binding protein [Paenibacillus sp. MMS18-CY102]MWC30765.1 extracellular solute-binding protein [Paenibacillus sp. MMS18-CY102]
MHNRAKFRLLAASIILSIVCLSVSACSLGEEKQKDVHLKIMYWDTDSFNKRFGDRFTKENPNITVEAVSMQQLLQSSNPNELNNLIEQQSPDILLLSDQVYGQMALDNRLLDLEPLMSEDGYALDGWNDSIVQELRAQGDGRLLGLAPTFRSKALYYNRKLFEQAGIPIPRDQMTWEETFQLAGRFGGSNNGLYGLYEPDFAFGQPYRLFSDIGRTQGLTAIQPSQRTVTLSSPQWLSIANLLHTAVQKKALYMGNGDSNGRDNLFLQGKATMALDGDYLLEQIKNNPDVAGDIGLVTVPVDSAHADSTPYIFFDSIYAINANSEHAPEAWKLIRYITETTMKESSAMLAGLPAIMPAEAGDSNSLEAFYKLQPIRSGSQRNAISPMLLNAFNQLANSKLSDIVSGKTEAEEGLLALSQEGQLLLQNK